MTAASRSPRHLLESASPPAPEASADDVSSTDKRPEAAPAKLRARGLSAFFGDRPALRGVDIDALAREVLAVIGPASSGKSTLLRCLNRMHEVTPGARTEGRVELDGVDVYGHAVDPSRVRRAVGMVLRQPSPFPTMSIRDNVLAGFRLAGTRVNNAAEVVEQSLRAASLWGEVKDRLGAPGVSLARGAQQRLCIARVLALEPEVVLLDEPCATLDPVATARIEELMIELKERYTLILVTHNMQQAARVSDRTAFFQGGSLVEVGPTDRIFTNPRDTRTEDYVTGRYG